MAVRAFMRRNRASLGRALPELGVRFAAPFRILVVAILCVARPALAQDDMEDEDQPEIEIELNRGIRSAV